MSGFISSKYYCQGSSGRASNNCIILPPTFHFENFQICKRGEWNNKCPCTLHLDSQNINIVPHLSFLFFKHLHTHIICAWWLWKCATWIWRAKLTDGPNYCPSRTTTMFSQGSASYGLFPANVSTAEVLIRCIPARQGTPTASDFGSGISLAKLFLELCCSLRLFLLNPPFFPVSNLSCGLNALSHFSLFFLILHRHFLQ